jgi:hypothetical protein
VANDPATATKPAAILSRPFYLAHRLATLTVKPGVAKIKPQTLDGPVERPTSPDVVAPILELPVLDADFEYHRVVNRWLYVFQFRSGKWIWAAEYWIDKEGGYHPVDMKQAQGKERDARPKPSKDNIKLLSLPYNINGKQIINGFFLSGTRLALQSVSALQNKDPWANDKNPGPILDIYDLDPSLYQGSYYIQDEKGESYIRVVDELWYAASVNKVLQQLRDLTIGWTVPAQDLDPETRSRTEQRAKKKVLAETIQQLVDHDPDDKLGLQNEFHPHPLPNYAADGVTVMRQWLKDYKATATWLMQNVDAAAKQLIAELDSPRMALVIESYLTLAKVDTVGFVQDMPLFLDEWSKCIDRMMEALAGAAWLSKIGDDPNHFVQKYVLEQNPPDGVEYQVVRKSTASLISIWKEIAVPLIHSRGAAYATTLVEALNHITLLDDRAIVKARNLILPNVILREKVVGTVAKGTMQYQTTVIVLPEHWAEDVHKSRGANIAHELEKAFFVVELINLSLSVDALVQSNGTSEQVWAAVGVLGSTLDATTASAALVQWRVGTMLKLGMLSAVIDTITALKQAVEMKNLGDISATIGAGAVAGGSALIAAGYAMSMFGGATAWTGAGAVVGIVGAVLVAIGYIIAYFTTDTPLELFVAHSAWGHRYGEDSGETNWSAGAFKDWHERNADGLARQVAAMTNLLAAFTFVYMGQRFRIKFGLLNSKTKVQITVDVNARDRHYSLDLVADLSGEKTLVLTSTPPGRNDLNERPMITYGEGFVEIDQKRVLAHYEDPSSSPWVDDPPDRLPILNCSVRLDFAGDGSTWVPNSGKWVQFSTRASSPVNSAAS